MGAAGVAVKICFTATGKCHNGIAFNIDGYVVSVMPSNNRLDLEWVNESLGRKLRMASEDELPSLFQDCELGAVPALSNAYGLDVIWDEQLTNASEIYIEAGDHKSLIHMHGDKFCKLVEDLPHNIISTGTDYSRWVSG